MQLTLTPMLAAALLVPTGTALAEEPSNDVRVAAMVEQPDGRLSVVTSTASSPARAQALARRWRGHGAVRAADVVHPVRALGTPDPLRSSQWGLSRLRAETAWSQGLATGQVVAVLDTGVDARHPDLAGVVAPGRDLVDESGTGGTDPHGHGTHVAGVIAAQATNGVGGAGLARGARILPIRVLDAQGRGYDAEVAEGVVWAVDHGATVVNLSLGGPSPSSLLTTAVRYALDRGVVVVAAAGNAGDQGNPVLYPAATAGVLAVGAVDRADGHPSWSSSGTHLDVAAPGVGVLSTVPGGYATWSGTSMAAPFASAAAALLRATDPRRTPTEVVARLVSTGQDVGVPGRDAQSGGGVVDVLAARAPATAPATAPAPAPATATAPAPAPSAPTLVVRTSRSAAVVPVGTAVVMGARVLTDGRPVAAAPVVLQRRVGTEPWSVVRRGTTDATGLVRWSLRPDRTGTHRVLVGRTVTAPLAVGVRQVVSTTVQRLGGQVVATATVAPGGRAAVALQVARSTGWVTVATGTTDTAGRVRIARALAGGTRVRWHVPARPHLLPAVSRTVGT